MATDAPKGLYDQLAPQTLREKRDEVRGSLIALQGKPLELHNIPTLENIKDGETRTWYLISDEMVARGGVLRVDGKVVSRHSQLRWEDIMGPFPYNEPIFDFTIYLPDGRIEHVPHAKLVDGAQFGIATYTFPTSEEMLSWERLVDAAMKIDEDAEWDYPPPAGKLGETRVLMPGGHELYDILTYGRGKDASTAPSKPTARIRNITLDRVRKTGLAQD